MIVTEGTKAMAQDVVDYIVENPERHNQANWVVSVDDGTQHQVVDAIKKVKEEGVCGTTMCIAGTAIYLKYGVEGLVRAGDPRSTLHFEHVGAALLGLDDEESRALFFEMDNDKAIDATVAIANGDEDKFRTLVGLG